MSDLFFAISINSLNLNIDININSVTKVYMYFRVYIQYNCYTLNYWNVKTCQYRVQMKFVSIKNKFIQSYNIKRNIN